MKRNVLLSTIVLAAGSLVAGSLLAADAGPKDSVKAAVKKLADAGGYSWKSTSQSAGGGGGGGRGRGGAGGSVEGKMGKDGIAHVTTTLGENTAEAYIKGDKRALKGQEGWQSLSELPQGGGRRAGGAGAAAGAGGRGGRGAGLGMFALRNVKPAAVQAEELLGKVKEIKSADGVYSGDLTEEGVKSLLTFGGGRAGGNAPEISGAKGSAKFWVKDGTLTKYEFNVQGKRTTQNGDVDINRTTTVEIKDVGTTTVTVPEEAMKKLS